ncbi:hypothetical protein F442_19905 [Phytophthora nicotianae P10297]|uniref:DDE-1 domain-containing protein n=1 Tax=Phytophthora nicotianae P10297 TaxID=1317064 RepID=W2YAH2_PHYNI|nr:hypothetical protein F442_19905 [Phytophthora nicotianae P10297]
MIRFAERVKSNAPFHLMWDEFSNHWTAEIPTCVKEVEVILLTAPGDYMNYITEPTTATTTATVFTTTTIGDDRRYAVWPIVNRREPPGVYDCLAV